MKMVQKLNPIDWSDMPKLKSDRKTDRLIAENVLRYHWCTHLPTGKRLWHWRDNRALVQWGSFKPSKKHVLTLMVIEDFVDKYSWSKDEYIKIEMSIYQKTYWNVRALKMTYGQVQQIYNNTEKNLALSLCKAMIASYMSYGPKDYANGWKLEWEGPDIWPI